VDQRIRFCRTVDGIRLAYAVTGDGPPLVKAPNYMSHLEYDWDSPVWGHWMEALSSHWSLLRYDTRGLGLSDIEVKDISLDAWVEDLATVVDAAGLDRFPLLGISAGGPVAIAYAARHPERVSRLVLYGSYARGRFRRSDRPEDHRQAQLLLDLMASGWGHDNAAFRHVFTSLFMPDGTPEQLAWFDELQRISTPPENAVRFERAYFDLDVRALAEQITAPALVLHARNDAMCPFDGGRELAGLLPHSEFVPLEGQNHILLEHEPAWERFVGAVEEFLDRPMPAAPLDPRVGRLEELTPRERGVVDLIARGLANEDIAERLVVSPATVRNHITRIYRKLGVRDRTHAALLAREGGLGR
jgi:pimeloyl-ACP methyl ester carboxylesterase/DNA-binding CsgD family transcriptional regulator